MAAEEGGSEDSLNYTERKQDPRLPLPPHFLLLRLTLLQPQEALIPRIYHVFWIKTSHQLSFCPFLPRLSSHSNFQPTAASSEDTLTHTHMSPSYQSTSDILYYWLSLLFPPLEGKLHSRKPPISHIYLFCLEFVNQDLRSWCLSIIQKNTTLRTTAWASPWLPFLAITTDNLITLCYGFLTYKRKIKIVT